MEPKKGPLDAEKTCTNQEFLGSMLAFGGETCGMPF